MNDNLQGYPLFRCNRTLFAYWCAHGILRRRLASTISKTWKTGVVILSPKLYAVGTVAPNGVTGELGQPWRRFEMWQICNAPSPQSKLCACRMFHDPESNGAWGDRADYRGRDQHHPHCQFERKAIPGFNLDQKNAWGRLSQGMKPQARPDEWILTREGLP